MKTILLATIILSAIACGGDADSPSSSARSQPGEAGARAYLALVNDALKDEDWSRLYTLMPPEYRAKCDAGHLTGTVLLAKALAGESFFKADVRIENLRVDGDRATYTSIRVLDNTELSRDELALSYRGGRWESADETDTSSCD